MKHFESYHPFALLVYFFSVIFVTMFSMNPLLIAISFVCSIVFCGMLIGINELLKSLFFSLIMFLLIALTNPLFVHRGETILFFLNDNPITFEAIIFGGVVAMMIISVFYWFKCYNAIITSDKFIYLFGRVLPKLALLCTLVVGFVPKFKKQFKEIDEAQKGLGIYSGKGFVEKIRRKLRVVSILVTQSLENSIQTSNSMRARGYGLKGRSCYSVFKWRVRDSLFVCVVSILTAFIVTVIVLGQTNFVFYPALSQFNLSLVAVCCYGATFVLMFLATIVEIKENVQWQFLKLKI